MKIEDVLRELEFRFRRGKGNSGAIGTLRIISGRNVDKEKELRTFFIDWQTDFDRVTNDQMNADSKGNWYQLSRKKTDLQVVH
jgi:hypothetical protein